jgi:hypothetical protein
MVRCKLAADYDSVVQLYFLARTNVYVRTRTVKIEKTGPHGYCVTSDCMNNNKYHAHASHSIHCANNAIHTRQHEQLPYEEDMRLCIFVDGLSFFVVWFGHALGQRPPPINSVEDQARLSQLLQLYR